MVGSPFIVKLFLTSYVLRLTSRQGTVCVEMRGKLEQIETQSVVKRREGIFMAVY